MTDRLDPPRFHPPGDELIHDRAPVTIDGHRSAPLPAPTVGQDTGEVLADALGLATERLDDLVGRGVIGTREVVAR